MREGRKISRLVRIILTWEAQSPKALEWHAYRVYSHFSAYDLRCCKYEIWFGFNETLWIVFGLWGTIHLLRQLCQWVYRKNTKSFNLGNVKHGKVRVTFKWSFLKVQRRRLHRFAAMRTGMKTSNNLITSDNDKSRKLQYRHKEWFSGRTGMMQSTVPKDTCAELWTGNGFWMFSLQMLASIFSRLLPARVNYPPCLSNAFMKKGINANHNTVVLCALFRNYHLVSQTLLSTSLWDHFWDYIHQTREFWKVQGALFAKLKSGNLTAGTTTGNLEFELVFLTARRLVAVQNKAWSRTPRPDTLKVEQLLLSRPPPRHLFALFTVNAAPAKYLCFNGF